MKASTLSCVAVLSFSSFIHASDPAIIKPQAVDMGNQAWTQPLLGVGVKTSDVYTDGHIFLTAPIWSTIGTDGTLGGDYVFLEPYSSLGDQGELATSLGLSWRHLFSDQPVNKLKQAYTASLMDEGFFIGGNIFVDMLRTHADNKFWQLGLGVEAGTRYIEARANYYLPFDDERKLAATSESTQTYVTQSSQSSTRYQTTSQTSYQNQNSTSYGAVNQQTATYGDPFATVNSIQQDVNLSTNIQNTQTNTTTTTATTQSTTRAFTTTATTTTTTKVKTVHSLFEEGMQGWDAEVAVLLPWLDQWCDVKLIGGYCSFDNQPFGPQSFGTGNVHGWKAALEIRPVPALVLDAIWYEDKRLTGSNWNVAVGLEIPMDKTWKDAFTPRRRHLVERLAEPVHRQNDAIKIGNSEEDKTSVSSTSHTSTDTSSAVVAQSTRSTSNSVSQTIVLNSTQSNTTQRITIKDNIIFVNNGPAVGNGIQAGSPSGDGTAERPVNTVQTGATLAGNNANSTGNVWTAYVQGGGTTTTYTGSVITTGSTEYFGSSQPIQARGGKVFGGTSANPVLDGAIVADATSKPSIKSVSVQGFTILHGSPGDGYAPIQITNVPSVRITKNIIQDSTTDFIVVTANDAGGAHASSVVVTDNSIGGTSSVGGSGVALIANNGGASITATVQNNSISLVGGDGVGVLATGSGGTGAKVTASITGNTIAFPSFNGVTLSAANDGTSITATVSNNTISDASGAGIYSESFGASNTSLTASNNTLTANASNSFDIQAANTAVVNFTASGNKITQAGLSGFTLSSFDASSLTATLDNNSVSGGFIANINAIDSNSTKSTGMTLFITNNTLSDGGNNSIALSPSNAATLNATVTGNTIKNVTSGSGVDIEPHDAAEVTATISNNTFTNIAIGGIFYSASGTSGLPDTLTANNNIFNLTGSSSDAIAVQSSRPNGTTFTANGNQITGAGLNGITLVTVNSATINSTLIGNTISGSAGGYGIAVLSANNPVGGQSVIINSNTITDSATAGIGLQTVAPNGIIIVNPATTPLNNIITGSGLQSMLGSLSNSSGNIMINGTIYPLPTDAP